MSIFHCTKVASTAMVAIALSSYVFAGSARAENEPEPTVLSGTNTLVIPKSWGKFIHYNDKAFFFEDASGTVRSVWVREEFSRKSNAFEITEIRHKVELVRK